VYKAPEYLEVFQKLLKSPIPDRENMHYWYSHDEKLSAAKMVFSLFKDVLKSWDIIEGTVFEDGHSMNKVAEMVSIYDTGSYNTPIPQDDPELAKTTKKLYEDSK
jgi:hypothetical protein